MAKSKATPASKPARADKSAKKVWQAGYAQGDITPPKGHTFMCGYGRERYATGTLAPLRAQALALRDARGRTGLLLAADILGFDRRSVEGLRAVLGRKHGLGPESIILSASHTHWGAGTLFKVNYTAGQLNPYYVKRLEDELLRLADEAIAGLADAGVAYQAIDARIGHNRRQPDGKGSVNFAINEPGHYDTHTPILRITRAGTPHDIVLVGHACHPTSSGGITKWSPDYPGAMRDTIERSLGNGAKAIFVMGCGADAKVTYTDPKTGKLVFSSSPKYAAAAGRKLAQAALAAMKRGEMIEIAPELAAARATGDLPLERPRSRDELERLANDNEVYFGEQWWARQTLAQADTRRAMAYEAQAWKLGGAMTILTLEGETVSELGPLARSLAPTPLAMVVGYANVMEGYIPTAKIRREGGYEGESSHRAYLLPAPFKPEVERRFKGIIAKATRALGR